MKSRSTNGKFAENPAYQKYEALLKQLHDLNKAGKNDSIETDLLCEEMTAPWYELSEPEQKRTAGLSADLYSLSGEELPISLEPEEQTTIQNNIETAYSDGDWEDLLVLLRRGHELVSPPLLAQLRGLCWQQLGHAKPAYWFFSEASRLEPQNFQYQILVLNALFDDKERRAEAIAQAKTLLDNHAKPQLVFGAAMVIFHAAAELPEGEAKFLYEYLVKSLRTALSQEETQDETKEPRALSPFARLLLASSLERLGNREEALKVYTDAIDRYPENDGVRLLRALFLLTTNPVAANRDLRFLVRRNTSFGEPYFFLAQQALRDKDYPACLELCDQGLLRSMSSEIMIPNLLEWKAIAHSELNHPDFARSSFQSALVLAPFNERIRRNLEVFERRLGSTREDFEIKAAMNAPQAMLALQVQLQRAA